MISGRAGAKILAENFERFNGDLRKALIAYIAGPGNVSKTIHALDQGKRVNQEILNHLDNVATAYKRFRRQDSFSTHR